MNSHGRKIDDTAADWLVRRESGLTNEEERQLNAWARADPGHAEAILRHEKAWALLEHQRETGRADQLVADLSRRSRVRRRRRAAIIAALGAVLLGVAARQIAMRKNVGENPAVATVSLPEKRRLADGSVVELRPEAAIEVEYSATARRVVLRQGEALFQVAKNKSWPFVVVAHGIEVRAVGTAFTVSISGQNTGVLVTEGRVQVSQPAAAAQPSLTDHLAPVSPIVLVDAGSELSVPEPAPGEPGSLLAQPHAVSPEEMDEHLAWRAARLEFSGAPLATAVAMMNEHSTLKVVIDDPALATRRVSGLFYANHTEAFVRILEANLGVTAERSGDTIVLRSVAR